MLDLGQDGGLQGYIVIIQEVHPKFIKKHLVPFLVSSVILRVLHLNAVVGQMARHVLEVRAVVRLRGRPQHTFSVQIDIVLMVHEHPAPKNSITHKHDKFRLRTHSNDISVQHAEHLPNVKFPMSWFQK